MVTGRDMPGYTDSFGLSEVQEAGDYTAQFISSTAPGNVLWPGEEASYTFQVVNTTQNGLFAEGKVEFIAYGTKGRPGDIWVPEAFRIAECGSVPVVVDLPAGGSQNLTVTPEVRRRTALPIRARLHHQTCAHRVALHIARCCQQVPLVHREGCEASLPQVTSPALPEVHPPRVAPVRLADGLAQALR